MLYLENRNYCENFNYRMYQSIVTAYKLKHIVKLHFNWNQIQTAKCKNSYRGLVVKTRAF